MRGSSPFDFAQGQNDKRGWAVRKSTCARQQQLQQQVQNQMRGFFAALRMTSEVGISFLRSAFLQILMRGYSGLEHSVPAVPDEAVLTRLPALADVEFVLC